jgi:hypothetical protein
MEKVAVELLCQACFENSIKERASSSEYGDGTLVQRGIFRVLASGVDVSLVLLGQRAEVDSPSTERRVRRFQSFR